MSRIGKQSIRIPQGITVNISPTNIHAKGPKGEMSVDLHPVVHVALVDSVIQVSTVGGGNGASAYAGLFRTLIANAIKGVETGWTKTLELSGVGYRASMSGNNLVLSLGFSHTITVEPPANITFTVNEGKIIVAGINKQLVGQIAANIRAYKQPEPYKGKGIHYLGERIRKKAGKSAKTVGGAPGAK